MMHCNDIEKGLTDQSDEGMKKGLSLVSLYLLIQFRDFVHLF
jgi:hypothetical protein